MKDQEKNYFALLLSLTFTTLLVIAATVMWFPDVGVWFKSPLTYLLCTGYFILLSVLTFFQLCSRDTTLRYIKEYGDTGKSKAMPYLILVFSFVIVYCLNILLLCAYLYSQRRDNIEVTFESFVKKSVSILTRHFWVIVVCLPSFIVCGLYLFGLLASYIFDLICHFKLDQREGSLVVCVLAAWFPCGVGLMVCYTFLPGRMLTYQQEWLLLFPLLCLEGSILAMMVLYPLPQYPLPQCPPWLFNLTWVTVVVTVVATILVQEPVTPPHSHLQAVSFQGDELPQPTATITVTTTVMSPCVNSLPLESSGIQPTATVLPIEPSAEQGTGIDADIQPEQLHYIQYWNREGKAQELRIKERLHNHCRDLAGMFGYETITEDCIVDAKNWSFQCVA